MKILCLSLLMPVAVACSRNSTNSINLPDGHSQVLTPERITIRSGDSGAVTQKRAGPAPLLLGPEALQVVYKDVFADSLSQGSRDFFDQTQKDELGGYRILKPAEPRGGFTPADSVMKKSTKLTADYVFALRKFTASACQTLIDKEIATATSPSNRIVEGENPSLEKISNFLGLMLGYQAKTAIHRGVQGYKDAFTTMMNSKPVPQSDAEKEDRLKAAYNHLCVALATDVRVYVR